MAPWKGPRHRSWMSNTNMSIVTAIAIIATCAVWDAFGDVPQWMITLVGLAGGAIFGALGNDKKKREAETEEVARRAEQKVDQLARETGLDDA